MLCQQKITKELTWKEGNKRLDSSEKSKRLRKKYTTKKKEKWVYPINVFVDMVHFILVAHTICGKDDAIKQSVIISSMEGYYKYSKVDGQCNVSEKNRLPLFSSDRNLRLI